MDVARAFVYMFDDREWVSKLLIGVLVALAGVLVLPLPILTGYLIAIARQVMQGDERLPTWDALGQYWREGLGLWVATLVYTLPFWFIPLFVGIVAGISGGLGGQDVAEALGTVGVLLSCVFGGLWAVFLLLLSPVLVVEYARTGSFAALFRARRVFAQLRACLGSILLTLVVGLVVGALASGVSTVLGLIPCLGWLLVMPVSLYPLLVMGHLYGQVGRTCPTA